jgi:acylglycerol lipase
MVIAHQIFLPKNRSVKGVVGLVHGYGDHTNMFMMDIAIRLCNEGYAVLMMDMEGHGRSDGLHAYIPNFENIVTDQSDFFLEQMTSLSLQDKPFFVYGFSMGGAVAFQLASYPRYKQLQSHMKGVILSAAMVKVADDLKPPSFIVEILRIISRIYPLAPITPIPDILDKAYHRKDIYQKKLNDILHYKKRVRLHTGMTLMHVTDELSSRLSGLNKPVLILHGESDMVTDPKLSKDLYNQCSSIDKTLNIYPNCYHDMLAGESEEQVNKIYSDMIKWLNARI